MSNPTALRQTPPHRAAHSLTAYRQGLRTLITRCVIPIALAVCLSAQGVAAGQSVPIPGLYIAPDLSLTPPEGMLIDAWYRLQLQGSPAGYMRIAMRRRGDRVESLDYTFVQIRRGPVTVSTATKTVTVETLDGKPLEIRTEQVFGNQPMKYHAVFQPNGSIRLTVRQGERTITRTLQADPSVTLPWALARRILTGTIKAGERFVERSYALALATEPIEIVHEPAGRAALPLANGRTVEAYRYRAVNEALGLTKPAEILCEPRLLVPLRFEIPILGMRLIATISTREQATATASGPAPELFVSLLVEAAVAGGRDPSKAERVLYTLTFPKDSAVPEIPSTSMQKVLARQGNTVKLLVTRRKPPAQQPARRIRQEVDPKYLAATAYADCDDPLVRKLAADAAGKESNPLRLAERLCRFVHRKMRNKGLDVAFATASEAAKTGQGDCTEHAVLLAALARARGLPARAAIGMVAMPGSYSAGTITFGYHMWTQIYVNGRWLNFDAALDQPRPDATHIALGISDLADSSVPLDGIRTFAQCAGTMQLSAQPQ